MFLNDDFVTINLNKSDCFCFNNLLLLFNGSDAFKEFPSLTTELISLLPFYSGSITFYHFR